MITADQIRSRFIHKKSKGDFVKDKSGCDMIEVIGEAFLANQPSIFGVPNEDYIDRELIWYYSKSRDVNDIPGKTPDIWNKVSDKNGLINSNYGWCIWSDENYNQFDKALNTLKIDPNSRQAVMIYTRPTMHEDATQDARSDFMCTNTVQYMIRDKELISIVQMRSNDLVFGYNNDWPWQDHIAELMQLELGCTGRKIIWQVGSLHVYARHFDLVK